MKKTVLFFSLALFVASCGGDGGQKSGNTQGGAVPTGTPDKQLNISIFLDLSDRIQKFPGQVENDIEIVKTLTEYFKRNMASLGAYKAKGKIRAFFSPPPTVSAINNLAEKLKIDCSIMDNKGRKQVYDSLTVNFTQTLSDIYQQTIPTSSWNGCDIWRFFKDDVADFCIDRDTNYRNILIIVTDGYIYHAQSVQNSKNRYSYLLNSNIQQYRSPNFSQLIDKNDFGLIVERNDLDNLEVLVLEVRAENAANKVDEDIIKSVLKKWFREMGVSRYEIHSANLPSNTKTRIDNFLK